MYSFNNYLLSAAPDTEISSSQIVPTHMKSKRHNGHHSLTEQWRKGKEESRMTFSFLALITG